MENILCSWVQYCENVCSSQTNRQIQCNFNQNASKLFYGLRQTDSKVCMKKQKTQNSQNNTREQKLEHRHYLTSRLPEQLHDQANGNE